MVMNIYVGHKPFGLAVNQENDKIYVTNLNNYTLTIIAPLFLTERLLILDPRCEDISDFNRASNIDLLFIMS